jgi:hypothetical protein
MQIETRSRQHDHLKQDSGDSRDFSAIATAVGAVTRGQAGLADGSDLHANGNRSDSFGDPIYVISSMSSSTSTRGRRRRSQAMQKTTKSKTKMQKRLLDLDSYGWKKENAKNDQRLKLKNGAI